MKNISTLFLIVFTWITISNLYSQVNPVHTSAITNNTGALTPFFRSPQSVFVSGNYAYVASSTSDALEIVDISNPAAPVHAGSIVNGAGGALLDAPRFVFVSGNYAYVASGTSDALEIVDISNPAVPVHAGSIVDGAGGALLDNPQSVFVSGNYAYVASSTSDALEIVDISNPTAPVHAGSIVDGAGGALLGFPQSVFVLGDYAYVVSRTSDALEIVDISNPAVPVHAGSIVDGAGGALLDFPQSVFVLGNYAYVASQVSDALEIVDISNPAAPVHAGSIVDGAGGALLDAPIFVFVSGDYAYVVSLTSNALEIVDISNPAAPVHTGSIVDGAGGALLDFPQSVYVLGNYAYVVSSASDALEIVTIAPNTDFISFEFQGITTTSDIDNVGYTVTATVPQGTVLSSLIAVFQLSSGASADIGGTAQISDVTSNDFTNSQTYTITAEDGTTVQNWDVSVVVNTDNENPAISFVSAPSTTFSGSTTITVNASDNIGISVVSFNFSSLRSINKAFSSVAASDQGAGQWSITLDGSKFDEMGLAFFLEAKDAAGNTAQTDTVYIYKAHDAANAPSIPSANLGAGGNAGDWRMFSIPYDLDDAQISSLFESVLGAYDKSKWRLVRYNTASDNFAEYKSGLFTIDIGKGYWFNSLTPASINIGPGQTPAVTLNQLAVIPLDNNWTQIGNPYTFNINWNDVLTFNSSSAGGLKVFTGGTSLTDATTLAAFDGAYVFSDGTDLQVPFTTSPISRAGARIKETVNSIDQEHWEVKISIESGEFSNHIGKIGMHPDADDSKDRYDAMRVPRFVLFADLTFYHPEFRYPWFSGDVVPRQEVYAWEFESSTNLEEPVILKWENAYFGQNEYELYLEDMETGRVISMRERTFYAYEADTKRKFKIHYGKSARIFNMVVGNRVQLNAPYPNPFNTNTVIPFTLPGKNGNFNVTLEIFDVLGNQIDLLCDKSFKPGIHNVVWDGKNSRGQIVSDGFYVIVMKITSDHTNSILSQKILKR